MAKQKCIYCGTKMTDGPICPLCKRENKEMIPIADIDYIPLTEEQLSGLRENKPGMFGRKIREEMLAAADDNRLLIGKVLTDGICAEDDGDRGKDYYQFVCKEDGTPISGRFYINHSNAISVGDGVTAFVISFQNKKGKRHYEIISMKEYNNLAKRLLELEVSLYQIGMYDEKRVRK